MELLNRDLQRAILTGLAAQYPEWTDPRQLGFERSESNWRVNAMYLAEHGLISVKVAELLGGPRMVHLAIITAKGLDFLQEDGGLGAILNVVTVRFEAETLRALIAHKVEASTLEPEEKSRIKGLLSDLSVDALKTATTRLVEAGLDRWPEALQWLQTLPG